MTPLTSRSVFAVVVSAGLVCLPACNKKPDAGGGSTGAPDGGARGSEPDKDSVTAAEDRKASLDKLKQIGRAMHDYESALGAFPGAALFPPGTSPTETHEFRKDVEAKRVVVVPKGLSWRVAILPYLEDRDAVDVAGQFKLNEPWDSDHNKKLVDKMPAVFAPPASAKAPPGHTFYRGFVGPQAFFPAQEYTAGAKGGPQFLLLPRGRRVPDILDGTSNTIMVVEAGEAVPWTKPEELPYDPNGPLPKLGGVFADGFGTLYVDGSAGFVPRGTDEKVIRAIVTPQGAEFVDRPGAATRPEPRPGLGSPRSPRTSK